MQPFPKLYLILGKVQTVEYISDALGFRVAATNLPVHVIPDETAAAAATVVAAEPAPAAAAAAATPVVPQPVPAVEAYSAPAPVITPMVKDYMYLPYAVGYRYILPPGPAFAPAVPTVKAEAKPVEVVAAPAVVVPAVAGPAIVAPGTAPSSQYHAEDEAGQYNYGYSGPLSSKQEVKSADGVVRGSYSYLDANGQIQKVDYISDVLGFRAVGTNIPGGASPSAPVMAPKVGGYLHLPYAVNHPYYAYQKQ